MPTLIVNVAVIHDHQVLLVQREDFEVWCLPGGSIEAGESAAQAAVREVKEETGLEVTLDSLVGLYSCTGDQPDTHVALFAAMPRSGTLRARPGEISAVRYFAFEALPEDLAIGYQKRIEDARYGFGGSVAVVQELTLPDGRKISPGDYRTSQQQTRADRLKFYQWLSAQARIREETEVAGRAQ